ncbi:GNAT family N-acetyltransferase [Allomuricauda sp. SCSIO 65647]|uniref:GNAT family N-acetyltransferase n=1 Tax=Allomuricauda sp. SCSIO 65647 TaxID=2908843 RepID=UPI001F3289BC|nr:GNAT family N-acetyltransferase [Muricauda sp. SCSIO 65647]UJH67905.1 GNAT family N-acetyltransferase [Muricauda sp. SCSIO 65647]
MDDKLKDLGYLSIGSQMRRVYEKLQFEGDDVYHSIGLNFKSSWFPIYHTIAYSSRQLSVMEITDRISYSRITVKNVAKELEKEDLAEIKVNPDDKRSKLFKLTAKGEALKPKLESIWESFSSELKSLFDIEGNNFLQSLEKVNNDLSKKSFKKNVLKNYYGFTLRNAKQEEFEEIGKLMVQVYSSLEGFPNIKEQPKYYEMLENVGNLTENPNIELIVAVSKQGDVGGAVVYFKDMKDYGSGGTATKEKNACGFRLLAVDPKFRGLSLGKELTVECISRGKKSDSEQIIIHTTKAMKIAWGMYEGLGFKRSDDLDFMQGELPVFGFRLKNKKANGKK